jgi:hypothetical protein
MAFITTYQLLFQNKEGQNVTINIADTESAIGTPTFIPLTCTSAELIVVNDSEDKFSTIKGKRLEFSFKSTASHHLSVFVDPTDNKWLVEGFLNATQIFSGWLVTDATREAFLPPETYIVSLTASDNLGLLKDLPLTKPDGTNPRGRFRLIDYVSWCLKKTGFNLPINIVNNLKPLELTTEHSFDKVYLNAKTFEQDINESEDCYTVLEKILTGSFLTQENNQWWIIRVDEMNGGVYNVTSYDADGVLTSTTTTTLTKNIGITDSIKFINKDAEVMPERPVLHDKLTYRLEFPREIVDNIDFNRGTVWLSPVVVDMGFYIKAYANLGSFPGTGEFDTVYKANDTSLFYKWTGVTYLNITGAEAPQGFAYTLEDWTLERQSGSVSLSAYVIKIRQFGDEKARYVEMSSGPSLHWIRSNRVPVGRFDKFTFSVDRRINTNATGSGQTIDFFAQIRLYGEDGTYWTITNYQFGANPPGSWVQSNSTFTSNNRYVAAQYVRNDVNESDWMAASVDANPLPVNGELEILLLQHTINGTSFLTQFSNLQFQYIPYINGSYQKYNSLYNKVSQVISTKNKKEDQVYLSDRIKPLFKGGLELKTAGGQYHAISGWYNGNAGTTGELAIASFGKYQAFEYWNQNRRIIRKFQGSLKGLDSSTQLPGLLHQYILTAPTEHTTNKIFMLLSYSQNLDTCQWTGIFGEVYDSIEDKLYTSTHELKFITDNG